MNLKLPETLTQLCSTLGVLNFYRSHISDFADIDKPLTDAMGSRKAKVHFPLGDSAKVAFEKFKKLACTAPVLVPPKYGEPFLLYTDASLYAVGCCLAQEDTLGNKHAVAYGSQKLTPTHSN